MPKLNYIEHCSENYFVLRQEEINIPTNLFRNMVTITSIWAGNTNTKNLLNTLERKNCINYVLSQKEFSLPSTFQRQHKVLL